MDLLVIWPRFICRTWIQRMHLVVMQGIVKRPDASRRSRTDNDVISAVWRRIWKRISDADLGIIQRFALIANIRNVSVVESSIKEAKDCGLIIQAFVASNFASVGIAVNQYARQQWDEQLDEAKMSMLTISALTHGRLALLAMTLQMIGSCCWDAAMAMNWRNWYSSWDVILMLLRSSTGAYSSFVWRRRMSNLAEKSNVESICMKEH